MKMLIDGKEIIGAESFKIGEGQERTEFEGSCHAKNPQVLNLKKGDPIKIYYDDDCYHDGVITGISNYSDGSSTIFFKNN